MNAYLELASDLFESGRDEDGEPFIGETFYVRYTAADGRRWVHEAQFIAKCRAQHTHVKAEGSKLLKRITTAQLRGTWKGPEGNKHWAEVQPAYGSEAYAKNWRIYAAQDDLADGNYDEGSMREYELRERASRDIE